MIITNTHTNVCLLFSSSSYLYIDELHKICIYYFSIVWLKFISVSYAFVLEVSIRPRGYKTFFMVNSDEHEILNAHKYKNIKKFSFV